MPWNDFGAGAVTAIQVAALAAGYDVDVAEVTTGEPAIECVGGVGVAAWISAIEEDPDLAPCLWVPPVVWTIRVVACLPMAPEVWHGFLEIGWCAVTAYVDECSAAGRLPCELVRFRGMTVLPPSGNMIHADYTWRVEDACEATE